MFGFLVFVIEVCDIGTNVGICQGDLGVLYDDVLCEADRELRACGRSVTVVFGIALVDRLGTSELLRSAAGKLEVAVFEYNIFDALIFVLTDDEGFADELSVAERIRLFEAEVTEGNALDIAPTSRNAFLARQTVSFADSDVNGSAYVRHIDAFEENVFNCRAVNGLERDTATVNVLDRTTADVCILEAIVSIRTEFDAGSQALNHHIVNEVGS